MSRDLDLEKRIDAYIKGKLTEEEAQELWEQLLLRPDYIELLETELGVKSIMESRGSSDTASPQSQAEENSTVYSLQSYYKKWAAAAAAVIAILVVAISVIQFDGRQAVSELAIESIDISTHLSSAPVLRSQKTDMLPSDSLLNRGFEAAISGDLEKALGFYNTIIDQYADQPAAVEAHLNKGIIQYNAGEFTEAISSFKSVLKKVEEKTITEEKAYWYMGNAYININELAKAQKAIQQAYRIDGIYHQPASRILKKLNQELGNGNFEDAEQ